jgi:hypothetical protein
MADDEQPAATEPDRSPWRHEALAAAPRRLVLGTIDVHLSDLHVTCRVELDRFGTAFTGEATELDSETGRARAAARATLAAAQDTRPGAHLALEGAVILDLFGRRYVALSIEAAATRQFTRLSGLLQVQRSVEESACLAALGAIERWLAL